MYLPDYDSLLLLNSLRYRSSERIIELGVGTGFILGRLKCDLAVGTDIDMSSLSYARSLLGDNLELVLCDSADAFRADSFDIAYFNPPYLPGKIDEDPMVIGGEDGSAIPARMLDSSAKVVRKRGAIFFVLSSNTKSDAILFKARMVGDIQKIDEMKLFFETLYVYMVKMK